MGTEDSPKSSRWLICVPDQKAPNLTRSERLSEGVYTPTHT